MTLFTNNFFLNKELIKLIKYGIIGILGLFVDIGIFYLANKKLGINYVVSNFLSSSLAVVHNFILNSHFTFHVSDRKIKRFVLFYFIAIIGMILSTSILFLFIDILKINIMISKIISIFFVAILQFYINKKITFQNK